MNFENILTKTEKNITSMEDFLKSYPEFLKQISEELVSEDGTRTYENENLKVSLKYELVHFDSRNQGIIPSVMRTGRLKAHETGNYYKITDLKIKTPDYEFDLMKDGGDTVSMAVPNVVFNKDPKPNHIDGVAYDISNTIELNSPPTSIGGLLIFIHEFGHLTDPDLTNDTSKVSKLEASIGANDIVKDDGYEKINNEIKKIHLKKERTAWARALVKFRPLIKSLNASDGMVEKFVHNYSLGTYSKDTEQEKTK